MRSQDSLSSVRSDTSTNSRRRLLPGANFHNNSSVEDYPSPSHYSRNRRARTVDDYAPHHTSKSKAPHSNEEDISFSSATTDISLSVNYLPSKFSGGFRNRKGEKYNDEPYLPKSGGGVYAFGSDEPRMPKGNGRWNKFKWILFATNSLVWFHGNLCNLSFLKLYSSLSTLLPLSSSVC